MLVLSVSLLANVVERLHYSSFLEAWSPGQVYDVAPWLVLCVFLSIPFSLLLLWWCWRPERTEVSALPRFRRIAGDILLALTLLLWLVFLYQALFAAWATATPHADILRWKKRYAQMADSAAFILAVGGLLSLWLKGIRMPPRNGKNPE